MNSKLKPLIYGGLGLAAAGAVGALIILIFGNGMLNGFGKRKMERAFAQALPGYALHIGELDYSICANRLTARSATLSAPNSTIKTGPIALAGVRWSRLLWGKATLEDILAGATLDAADLDLEFPLLGHGIRGARLLASVPDSELTIKGIELRPLLDDEEFFAAFEFRKIRYRATAPECRVSGLAFGELLGKKAYRARSVVLSHPSVDALVNRDKPVKPVKKPPLTATEALVAIRLPLQIAHLRITGGDLQYGERSAPGAAPGVWTVTSVNMTVENIANRGEAPAVILLRGRGAVMDAAVCEIMMTIPIVSPDFSLHYSGSIGAMDLARFNAFLEQARHARIKSGMLKEGSFDIDVTDGRARGLVRATYDDLKIALIDEETGSAKGWGDRAASFTVNAFKIRNSNAPDGPGAMKTGTVSYPRDPQERFLKFAWRALRSGIFDVVSH
ncbi:MAG TPA: hypothetical protein DCS11_08455 [Syntrophus sp. (in: bacteria)]|jgi:hypothetical protein|nr:hypothetical protein [Syntrophus sp. (in: bacteria)]